MTTAADDSAVEDAFEALLAGRPAPDGAAGLAAFTEAVRATATSPGRPNAALAELLATGLLVDQSSPSQTARSAGSPEGSRSRIRRRTAMFFPALLAKLLSAGAVAQAATGATVVVVAFTGAGAAGLLPGPVQDTFTSIVSDEFEVPVEEELPAEPPVNEVPPVEEAPLPEAPIEEAPVGEVPVVDDPAAEPLDDGNPWTDEIEWATNGPIAGHPFGEWVSYGRTQGWGDGELVSCWAHERKKERPAGTISDCAPVVAPVEDGSEGVDPVVDEPAVDDTEGGAVTTQQSVEDDDRRGHGNGNGRGDGNGRGGDGRN